MPVTRVGLIGGILAGLGHGLDDVADARIRRRELADQHAFELQKIAQERAYNIEQGQMNLMGAAAEKIAADPTLYSSVTAGLNADPRLQQNDFMNRIGARLLPLMKGSDQQITNTLNRQTLAATEANALPNVM